MVPALQMWTAALHCMLSTSTFSLQLGLGRHRFRSMAVYKRQAPQLLKGRKWTVSHAEARSRVGAPAQQVYAVVGILLIQ